MRLLNRIMKKMVDKTKYFQPVMMKYAMCLNATGKTNNMMPTFSHFEEISTKQVCTKTYSAMALTQQSSN